MRLVPRHQSHSWAYREADIICILWKINSIDAAFTEQWPDAPIIPALFYFPNISCSDVVYNIDWAIPDKALNIYRAGDVFPYFWWSHTGANISAGLIQ